MRRKRSPLIAVSLILSYVALGGDLLAALVMAVDLYWLERFAVTFALIAPVPLVLATVGACRRRDGWVLPLFLALAGNGWLLCASLAAVLDQTGPIHRYLEFLQIAQPP
ncbi:MAG TPA: hypothetical protein VJ783_15300 [Pirellulales bacterium]|nr:hypothetical protein [Pirellulales bacterium]